VQFFLKNRLTNSAERGIMENLARYVPSRATEHLSIGILHKNEREGASALSR